MYNILFRLQAGLVVDVMTLTVTVEVEVVNMVEEWQSARKCNFLLIAFLYK